MLGSAPVDSVIATPSEIRVFYPDGIFLIARTLAGTLAGTLTGILVFNV